MNVIVCLDDRCGMAFHHRRQSRDRLVVEDLLQQTRGRRLLIEPYSAPLFAETGKAPVVDGDFLSSARDDDYCFVEKHRLEPVLSKIKRIVIYRWNRIYPADFYFDVDLSKGWNRISAKDFAGYSHEKITKEIYSR